MFDPALVALFLLLGFAAGNHRTAVLSVALPGVVGFWSLVYVLTDGALYDSGRIDALFWVSSGIASTLATVAGAGLRRAFHR